MNKSVNGLIKARRVFGRFMRGGVVRKTSRKSSMSAYMKDIFVGNNPSLRYTEYLHEIDRIIHREPNEDGNAKLKYLEKKIRSDERSLNNRERASLLQEIVKAKTAFHYFPGLEERNSVYFAIWRPTKEDIISAYAGKKHKSKATRSIKLMIKYSKLGGK